VDSAARPRILLRSVPPELVPEFEGIPGTLTFVSESDDVHPSDHDLLVTFEGAPPMGLDWHVLAFGVRAFNFGTSSYKRLNPHSVARDVFVSDNEDARAIRGLIERTILATLPPPPRATWVPNVSTPSETPTPLVQVGQEKRVYAFRARKGSRLRMWALPEHTTEHRAWLLHVLEVLHEVDPDRFPGDPEWQAGTRWATPELAAAHDARRLAEEQLQATVAAATETVAAAEDAVTVARSTAATGMWRLLTAEGDDLVDAVQAALTDLGFDAKNVDDENRLRHGRRLEDLRVADPEQPDWESLTEVKGYTKGAKVTDVHQVTQHPSMYFAIDRGRGPRTVWHVVNAWREKDPTLRESAIPNDADLKALTDAPGALIDTRDLFRAWRDVQNGRAAAADVRHSLRTAVTRWKWPA